MRTSSSLFNQGLTAKAKSVKHFLTLRRQEKGLFLIMLRFASVAFPLSYNTSILQFSHYVHRRDVHF